MLYNFDLGDRIPEGFIPDSSLLIAGKAIEEVAKRRWLNAEELLLLLMLPNSLNIEYLNALPSADHPPKVGRIYLIPGDSKQSMQDGIEYEKRQTEDRSNTQSGIYSQLSINKRQVIEGVYSTTSTTLRRRYYYMRDEKERIRKIIHYREITDAELLEAANRREGKKKVGGAIDELLTPTGEKPARGRKSTSKTAGAKSSSYDDAAAYNEFGLTIDVEGDDLPIKTSSKTACGPNPNKTIPIHSSVLYNCYKYLYYKDYPQKAEARVKTPSRSNSTTHPPTGAAAAGNIVPSPLKYTYVRTEEDLRRDSVPSQFPYPPTAPNLPQFQVQPIALISPAVLAHHTLKYTQHCTIVLSNDSLGNFPVHHGEITILFEKILQDPSLMIPGANISTDMANIRGEGRQLTPTIFECVVTAALSAGQWKLFVLCENQVIGSSTQLGPFLTIVEESREERFESLKRRRQKSKSVEESPRRSEEQQHPPLALSFHPPFHPSPYGHYAPPVEPNYGHPSLMMLHQQQQSSQQQQQPFQSQPYLQRKRGDSSEHSSGMMTEALSLLRERSTEGIEDETVPAPPATNPRLASVEMQTSGPLHVFPSSQNSGEYYRREWSMMHSSEGIAAMPTSYPPGEGLAPFHDEPEDHLHLQNSNNQAYFPDRTNFALFVEPTLYHFSDYQDMYYYSVSETDSNAVSSASHSDAESGDGRGSGTGSGAEGEEGTNSAEIIRILSHQMSLEEEGKAEH